MPRANITYPYTFTDKDVKDELQKLYPDLNVDKLCTDIFTILLKRITTKGSVTITGFGRFKGYINKSTKLGRKVFRIKFLVSPFFLKKIRDDKYTIDNFQGKEEDAMPFYEETLTKKRIASRPTQSRYEHISEVKDSIADILAGFDIDSDE